MEKEKKKKIIRNFLIGLFFTIVFGVILFFNTYDPKESAKDSFQLIRSRGYLIAITEKNSLGYFIYRGDPMGFQLDLLKSFSDWLGVPLKILVSNDVSKMYYYLDHHAADLVAMNLPVSPYGKGLLHYTEPMGETRLVIVQSQKGHLNKKPLRSPADLEHDTVYLPANQFWWPMMNEFVGKYGYRVNLFSNTAYTQEELIRNVSEGKLGYAICEEERALVCKRYYRNIDASVPVSHYFKSSWAVAKSSDSLLVMLDTWLQFTETHKLIRKLREQYENNPKAISWFGSDFFSVLSPKISRYDDVIRSNCKIVYWDWRLIAALMYEESNFHPDAVSSKNAGGLMQMMPETAAKFGVDSLSSPEQQIRAGIRYLKHIDKQLPPEINDPGERISFILASYNVGIGRVLACREKEAKRGLNPDKGKGNVDYFLTRRSKKDPVPDTDTLADFLLDSRTGGFVNDILERYHHYRNLIPQ